MADMTCRALYEIVNDGKLNMPSQFSVVDLLYNEETCNCKIYNSFLK